MRALWLLTLGLLTCSLLGCGGCREEGVAAPTDESLATFAIDTDLHGLRIGLSEGDAGAFVVEQADPAEAVPLDDARLAALLEPFASLQAPPPAPFSLASGPEPPPLDDIEPLTPLPWEEPGVPRAAGELKIVHHSPVGETSADAAIVVMFSRPMVDLDTGEEAGLGPGFALEPRPAGRWRWSGARTAVFEPQAPLPMATTFEVSVPAGTAAVGGATLPQAHHHQFVTAPPTLIEHHPGPTTLSLQPVVVLTFDQRIEPGEILPLVSLRTGDAPPVALERVLPGDLQSHPGAWRVAERAAPDTWVALRPTSALESGASYDVVLRAGLPSTEGPGTSAQQQTFSFRAREATQDAGVGPGSTTGEHHRPHRSQMLWGPADEMLVLSPRVEPRVAVSSAGLDAVRVRVHGVQPHHWPRWCRWRYGGAGAEPGGEMPGEPLVDEVREVAAADGAIGSTHVDLGPLLRSGRGQFVVWVTPASARVSDPQAQVRLWVQVTDVGIVAHADDDELLAWITSLSDGRPVPGAVARFEPGESSAGTTDERGQVRIDLEDGAHAALVVRRGVSDVAILPAGPAGGEGWRRHDLVDTLRWYTVADRERHRPGEPLFVKGWLRRQQPGPDGALVELEDHPSAVVWALLGPDGETWAEGRAELSMAGGFDVHAHVPDGVGPGEAILQLEAVGAAWMGNPEHRHAVPIDGVGVTHVTIVESEGIPLLGERLMLAVEAKGPDGRTRADADLLWSVTSRAASFQPPGFDDFRFGPLVQDDGGAWETARTLAGTTDLEGRHQLELHFQALNPVQPVVVTAAASVTGEPAETLDVLVHPSELYVGLRHPGAFVPPGEPLQLDVVVVDHEGATVPGVHVQLRLEPLAAVDGVPWAASQDVVNRSLMSGPEPVSMQFPASVSAVAGGHVITAVVRDGLDRPGVAQIRIHTAGARPSGPASEASGALALVPLHDRETPGQPAELLLLSSVYPADGLLTVQRDGIVTSQPFQIEGPARVLRVDVDESSVPGVTVRVDLPTARAEAAVRVEPAEWDLDVVVLARDALVTPGGQTEVQLSVADRGGRPVMGAEVAVFAVRQPPGLALGHDGPDPLAAFGAPVDPGVRARRLDAMDEDRIGRAGRPGGPGAGASEGRDSAGGGDLTALFVPAALTDGAGTATVTLAIPEQEGAWQLVAVAADGGQRFGTGSARVVSREPMVVSAELPPLMTLGDRLSMPLELHNRGVDPLTVELAVRASGAHLDAEIEADAAVSSVGWRVTVPGRGRVGLACTVAPTQLGPVQVQVFARSGSIVAERMLATDVRAPVSTESHVRHGTLTGSLAVLPLELPWDAWPQVGGLEVSTSASDLLSLTDAVLALYRGGSESTVELASRVLALSTVHDVSEAFGASELGGGLGPRVIEDLAVLASLQRSDGGFATWDADGPSVPFPSIHAIHALAVARSAGFDVPWSTWTSGLAWLQQVDQHIPGSASSRSSWALRAYALRVRQLMQDPDVPAAQDLLVEAGLEALSLEAHGWLLPLLAAGEDEAAVAAMLALLQKRVIESPTTAHFADTYSDGKAVVWHSDRRADAVILAALLDVAPEHPLVARLSQGLLTRQRHGHWSGCQENVFAVMALHRLAREPGGLTQFRSRVWLGQGLAREHMFRGDRPIQAHVQVPMSFLDEADDEVAAIFGRTGAGALRYRVGLQFAEREPTVQAQERGLSLQRVYEAIDDPGDVTRAPDGSWQVRSGARVRVTLRLATSVRRYHLVVEEPLSAGLQPLDFPQPAGFPHRSVEPGRIRIAAPALGVGLHEISYVARATASGSFAAPPATAALVLDDGVAARSRGEVLIVQ